MGILARSDLKTFRNTHSYTDQAARPPGFVLTPSAFSTSRDFLSLATGLSSSEETNPNSRARWSTSWSAILGSSLAAVT